MDNQNSIKNENKQNYDSNHDHKMIKDLEVLKKLSDKILSTLNNYLSK